MYSTIAEKEIDLSIRNKTYQFFFENKYPGNHSFQIYVEKNKSISDKKIPNTKLKLEVFEGKQLILKKFIEKKDFSPFMSYFPKRKGFILFLYKVPKDLPRGKKLKASITILEEDKLYLDNFGKISFAIQKKSDE